jgi:hypothetical protein
MANGNVLNDTEALIELVCGPREPELADDGSKAILGLTSLISSYYSFSKEFCQDINTPQSSYFLPVSLRSLMESSAIVLLARVDPLRVILSSKSQDNTNYKKSQQQPSAISWRNDIAGDTKGAAPENAPKKDIWDPATSSSKLPRHLLSENMIEAIWTPAASNLSNHKNLPNSKWLNEILQKDAKSLINSIIGGGNMLYSELSKGIHPEFAVRREAEYDGPTLLNYTEKTVKWITSLSLLSHFAPSYNNRLPTDAAVSALLIIEEAIK